MPHDCWVIQKGKQRGLFLLLLLHLSCTISASAKMWMIYCSSPCCLVLTAALNQGCIWLPEGTVVFSTAACQTCISAVMRARQFREEPGGYRVTQCRRLELLWYNRLCYSSLRLQRPWWHRTAVKTMCECRCFVSDLGVVMKCGARAGTAPLPGQNPKETSPRRQETSILEEPGRPLVQTFTLHYTPVRHGWQQQTDLSSVPNITHRPKRFQI